MIYQTQLQLNLLSDGTKGGGEKEEMTISLIPIPPTRESATKGERVVCNEKGKATHFHLTFTQMRLTASDPDRPNRLTGHAGQGLDAAPGLTGGRKGKVIIQYRFG
ncbi:hypothetical protein CDAR_236901 [Caerostris darwini]|uniref:Uncharacterized protein n=1 Tax=Caerostris darwini TaxID=1538125 RepID=A0AAV4S664_9ARAC|nr:hypothetical protein CDAR_236901 [Caerostris darwini]